MLHLLSKLPATPSQWSLLGTMLSIGDKVVIYEEAVNRLHDASVALELLKWLHQGVKLVVLSDELVDFEQSPLAINKALLSHLQYIDWPDMVDMVAESTGVQSL